MTVAGLEETEWKKVKRIIKAARKMVFEDPAYWDHDFKEPEARELIEAIKDWDRD